MQSSTVKKSLHHIPNAWTQPPAKAKGKGASGEVNKGRSELAPQPFSKPTLKALRAPLYQWAPGDAGATLETSVEQTGHETFPKMCEGGDVHAVRLRLTTADLNAVVPGEFKRSPLTASIFSRQWQISDLLLKAGADVNGVDGTGERPLQAAIAVNQPDMVERLIAMGACAALPDRAGRTAMEAAVQRNNVGCVEALVRQGVAALPPFAPTRGSQDSQPSAGTTRSAPCTESKQFANRAGRARLIAVTAGTSTAASTLALTGATGAAGAVMNPLTYSVLITGGLFQNTALAGLGMALEGASVGAYLGVAALPLGVTAGAGVILVGGAVAGATYGVVAACHWLQSQVASPAAPSELLVNDLENMALGLSRASQA